MDNTNIRYSKKKSLSQYVLDQNGNLTLLSLFLIGVITAVLHQNLRLRGLNIPGHHGLELMTMLLFARMQSGERWAGMVVAAGAATAYLYSATYLPLVNSLKPMLVFVANAFIMDCLYRYTPRQLPIIIKGMILGGVSFIIKPLVYFPVAIFMDVSFGSFSKHGYLLPFITHFTFGSIGAICGITLAHIADQLKPKNQ